MASLKKEAGRKAANAAGLRLAGIAAHNSLMAEAAMREHLTGFQTRIRDLL